MAHGSSLGFGVYGGQTPGMKCVATDPISQSTYGEHKFIIYQYLSFPTNGRGRKLLVNLLALSLQAYRLWRG